MSLVRRAFVLSLTCVTLFGTAARAAEDDQGPGGGFAVELSGGLSGGSLQGGLLLGIAVRNFLWGLYMDSVASMTVEFTDAMGTRQQTEISGGRIGIAARAPLLTRSDGRVVLFAAGDVALVNQSVAGAPLNGLPTVNHVDGPTWSLGPGLRYWVTKHLAIGYVTRMRFSYLSGSAGALGQAGTGLPPDMQISADTHALEGALQLLAVF